MSCSLSSFFSLVVLASAHHHPSTAFLITFGRTTATSTTTSYFLLLLILPVTVNTDLHLWLLLPTTTMIHLKSWNPSWISKCSCLYGISWNGVTIAKGICHGNSWWDIHQCRSTWIGKFKSSGTIFQLTSEPTDSWAACFTTNRVSDWIGLDWICNM